MDQISYGEAHLYQGKFIWCQSYNGDYVHSCGGVAMSDDDGMDSSTQLLAVRCVWAPVAMSCRARHEMSLIPKDSALVVLTRYWKPPGAAAGAQACVGPGYSGAYPCDVPPLNNGGRS
jgi:hypothetical protein